MTIIGLEINKRKMSGKIPKYLKTKLHTSKNLMIRECCLK